MRHFKHNLRAAFQMIDGCGAYCLSWSEQGMNGCYFLGSVVRPDGNGKLSLKSWPVLGEFGSRFLPLFTRWIAVCLPGKSSRLPSTDSAGASTDPKFAY